MKWAARRNLLVFMIISLVAVGHVGTQYAGLQEHLRPTTYPLTVMLADSGGLFDRAEVTYRGVTVGRVKDVEFRADGVTAHLAVDRGVRVPDDLVAEVHNRSAVGEQYIDLVPRRDEGPWLEPGDTIAQEHTSVPVGEDELLLAADRFLRTVDVGDLRTVVDELGTAFGGAGQDLQTILDSSEQILDAAVDALPATTRLLRGGETVLRTQDRQAALIASFLGDLDTLAGVVADQDGDLRVILRDGAAAAEQLELLTHDLEPGLQPLLADLAELSGLTTSRLAGLEETLVAMPYALASARTPGRNGLAHFAFVASPTPDPCRRGYTPATDWRSPHDLDRAQVDPDVGCTEPVGTVPRGAETVTSRGDPGRGRAVVVGASPTGSWQELWTLPLLAQ